MKTGKDHALERIEKCRLTKSKFLDLTNLRLTEVSEEVCELQWLTSLNLSFNQIYDITFLAKLTGLTTLNLSFNPIQDVSFLAKLTGLTSLYLSWNLFLQDLSFLEKLTGLTDLDLSSNQIQDVSFLEKLTGLTDLDLSSNQIQDISFLENLTDLTTLNLSNNQIQDISFLEKLTGLTFLDLSRNQIQSFPKFILSFSLLRHIFLWNNPISDIPFEIGNQHNCLSDARNWFYDLGQGKHENCEVKLILIGNGKVGKTCILKRLIYDTYDKEESSTHAINLEIWEPEILYPDSSDKKEKLTVNIWDFGGQDIYHTTHRLFMQSRALYLLVWDWKTEQEKYAIPLNKEETEDPFRNYPLEHWLDYVRSLSKNSPVILVQNKVDRDKTKSIENLDGLNQIYTIYDCQRVSAKTNRGIEDLKALILEAFQKMPEVGMEMPLSWYKVRQKLAQLTDSSVKDIAYQRFTEICEEKKVREISCPSLLRYLHDTGVLFYRENLFSNRIILDQKWAINAVYTLFDRKGVFYHFKKKNGEFTLDDLEWTWKEYSLEERKVFLSFMKSCELCFELEWDEKNPVYIAPQLLPSKKPKHVELNWKNKQGKCLHLIYHHQFLHSAIIQRFIVRTGHLAEAPQMWKNGISIYHQSSEALIEVIEVEPKKIDLQNKPSAEVISIQVSGSDSRELLQRIRNEFENIHHFEAAPVEWISVNGIDFIAFEEFKKYWNNSETQILIAPSGNKVELKDLMEFLPHEDREQRPGAEKPGIRELPSLKEQPTMTKPKAINIFISYSHKDEDFKDELVDIWLKPLKRNINLEDLEVWNDRKILVGQEWQPVILEKLNSAEVIILLLSQLFLASDFCTDIEMNRALERRQAEGILVIPILIRDCTWEDLPIARLQIVPRDGKPLNSLKDRDTAWKTVVQEIKKTLAAREIR